MKISKFFYEKQFLKVRGSLKFKNTTWRIPTNKRKCSVDVARLVQEVVLQPGPLEVVGALYDDLRAATYTGHATEETVGVGEVQVWQLVVPLPHDWQHCRVTGWVQRRQRHLCCVTSHTSVIYSLLALLANHFSSFTHHLEAVKTLRQCTYNKLPIIHGWIICFAAYLRYSHWY